MRPVGDKSGSLQDMAAKMLRKKMRKASLETAESAAEELHAQLSAGRSEDTVTVAQAIVLAMGKKALNGDKTAAEYLQRLADQAEERRSGEREKPEKNLVIRVRMVDGAPEEGGTHGEGAEPDRGNDP